MPHASSEERGARFVEGPLWHCITSGGVFLADELNLTPPALVSVLAHLLEFPATFTNPISGDTVDVHPAFGFVATQNPAKYAGRNLLPLALQRRVVTLVVPPYDSRYHTIRQGGGDVTDYTLTDSDELAAVLLAVLEPHQLQHPEAFVLAALAALNYDPTGEDDSTGLRHFLKL